MWFSLALDVTYTITLLFIWGVNGDFEVTEELFSMNSLPEQLQGNVFKVEKKVI